MIRSLEKKWAKYQAKIARQRMVNFAESSDHDCGIFMLEQISVEYRRLKIDFKKKYDRLRAVDPEAPALPQDF